MALRSGESTLTYSELDRLAGQVAADLRNAGVEPGDRVAVMLPNVPAFASLYYGAMRAGAVVVPMNPLLKAREVEHYLGDPDVKVVYVWADFRAAVETVAADLGTVVRVVVAGEFEEALTHLVGDTSVAERDGAETAVILYTSGTTGKPKGAELTHGGIGENIRVSTGLFGTTADDIVIGALPLFHAFGQVCALNCAIASGAELVIISRFEPQAVLSAVATHRATMFMGVPTMYAAMVHVPNVDSFDASSLRMCVSGGAALPLEILSAFERQFQCVLLEGYGLSETSPVASFNRIDQKRAGSIGLPIPGVAMRILDDSGNEVEVGQVGEIAIKGHNIMKGYWRRPQETAAVIDAEGWFRSGDLGRQDEDGFFYVVDRKKELVIRGGYNVYPREIEEVLYEHPAVREAAVVGIPHADLGEEVGAAVALTSPDATTVEELLAYVKERVAPYKYPRRIWFVEELPKGATNKILKREIAIPASVSDA